jgi:hypothetical protein
LFSAWLICAVSIERCIAVIWPLLIRQVFNMGKTKVICTVIFIAAALIQTIGLLLTQPSCPSKHTATANAKSFSVECKCVMFDDQTLFFKIYLYFNQLTCLILIPSLIVICCNSVVFCRIIKRRKMLDSGKMYNFKINQGNVPVIRITKCSTADPEIILDDLTRLQMLASSTCNIKRDAESTSSCLNGIHEEDYISVSTTQEESRSVDSRSVKKFTRIKKTQAFRNRAKLNKDIKLILLMSFSASFLLFVMPEGLLNIYQYHFIRNQAAAASVNPIDTAAYLNMFNFLHEIFFMLKLVNYSSNFLAYLTLATFSKVKLKDLKKVNH